MFRSAMVRIAMLALLTCTAAGMIASGWAASQDTRVVVFPVQGVIGPATSDYLIKGLTDAAGGNAMLAVIELDTPGGLDSSMRAIVQAILASPIPVATFVSPAGARAASAGTFILYASHIAAMTPASNLGAASPVSIGLGGGSDPDKTTSPQPGGDDAQRSPQNADTGERNTTGTSAESASEDVMTGKVKSDAAAYIRSLAQLRGRNVTFAEQAVLNAKSLSAHEALEQGVIDYIASDLNALLKQINGKTVTVAGDRSILLHTDSVTVQIEQPGWRIKVLSVLTNPQLALVLMMVGIYGLFFELTSPGFALPGVAGTICLLLGLYAFHLLPVNWAGVALLFVGASLMISEVFLPSFGVLGIGGVIAFVLGGLFLTDTGIPGFDLSLPFLIGLGVSSALLMMLAGTLAARAYKRKVVTGNEAMLNEVGTVTGTANGLVYAQIRGEQWRVVSDVPLVTGDRVRVVAVQGLILKVVQFDTPSTNNVV